MSEENTANLESEMMQVAEEAIQESSEQTVEDPVWEDDGLSESFEAQADEDDSEPQTTEPSATDEPQSDEKQETEQKLIPQSTFEREIAKERQKKRDAHKEVNDLKMKLVEFQEQIKMQNDRQAQLQQLIRDREAMDPMESQLTEQQWKLQQVEAQERVRAQQQQMQQEAAYNEQKATLRQKYIDEASGLESKTGVPAAQILIAFSEAGDNAKMEDVANDLEQRAYARYKERLARDNSLKRKGVPKPMKAQGGAKADLLDYKNEDELEAAMYKSLKLDGFVGS